MANDWSGVDNPEFIPNTENDAGDYIRIEKQEEQKRIEELIKQLQYPDGGS